MKLKKFAFPTAFTILFAITVIVVGLTWIIPAGEYQRLSYNSAEPSLVVAKIDGSHEVLPATQATLNDLNVSIEINKFTDGTIKKPIAIPGTYERVAQQPKGIMDITESMVKGTIEGADVIVFILVLGGLIGVVNQTGAFNAGLTALANRTKGKEFLVVFGVTIILSIGGTSCGIEEEAVAFYPILVPIFLILGYDAIVCVGAIFLASSMGAGFSTVNPFSVVIASNASGISFIEGIGFRTIGLVIGTLGVLVYLYWYCKKIKKDPTFSYNYENAESFKQRFLSNYDPNEILEFSWRRKVILCLFVAAFPIMVWGVMDMGWWFPQMAALFLAIAIIIIFLSGLKEKTAIDGFIHGASELVGVSLIIGLARGVNLVMEQGKIADTILEFMSHIVAGMPPSLFLLAQLVVFICLGFIVPSSSGLAVLAMPIMAPLADAVGVPRYMVVSAYNWGQYIMLFLAPTGLVLATLQMLDISYNKWLKFIMPMVIFMFVLSATLLLVQVAFL
ncbi:YfcC family protein [Proteus faecis]|uniref:YfcC family protein n=1 Tax=Proteus faecis TaxID=2050967 RepID=A0AAW7CTT3_9GAMM|nr:YfcC family protein [Proteus faecis]MBG3012436.1 YfcC family protein [Proteus mirabilis]MDO5404863.1 YfcC family protein [Proteus sp. (in: enterobacteria)]QNH66074.1 YfcC family protein [Proteus vulgaris]MCT8249123.1 YfcC family protein [Proteus faecis]MDL5167252.1 YfcC family protein [Proteus faecis]